MPATTIFDSIDEVPESVRDKATEVEGKYHVDATAFVSKHNEILGEKKQRDADIKRLKADVEKYKDLDPEKAREALQKIADAEAEQLKVKGDWDAREKALKDGFATKETEYQSQLTEREKSLDKLVIINELARVASLPDVKGDFELLSENSTVMRSIRRKGTEDYEILDAKANVRYGTDGLPLRMEAYLKELREHPKLSRLFDASGASGSGAPADTGGAGGKQKRRSEMTDKERQDYIRQHSYAKYKELPE